MNTNWLLTPDSHKRPRVEPPEASPLGIANLPNAQLPSTSALSALLAGGAGAAARPEEATTPRGLSTGTLEQLMNSPGAAFSLGAFSLGAGGSLFTPPRPHAGELSPPPPPALDALLPLAPQEPQFDAMAPPAAGPDSVASIAPLTDIQMAYWQWWKSGGLMFDDAKAPALPPMGPQQFTAAWQRQGALPAVDGFVAAAKDVRVKAGANLYLYAVSRADMVAILRAGDSWYNKASSAIRAVTPANFLTLPKEKSSTETMLTGRTLLLPIGHPTTDPGFSYGAHLAGSLVLLCCREETDEWDWRAMELVGLGVFAGPTHYRNTLDSATRLDILVDQLTSDEAMVDGNAAFLPVVCLTPLLAPRDQTGRRVTYADFLDASRPETYRVPRPAALTAQLYVLCSDVHQALYGNTCIIIPPWVHAKALLQIARQYGHDRLLTDVAQDPPRQRIVRALHDYLRSWQPREEREDLVIDHGLLPKTLSDFDPGRIIRDVLVRRYTTRARLHDLRAMVS